MSGLPEFDVIPAPQWQRRRLAEWLNEWRIDRILREGAEELPDAATTPEECNIPRQDSEEAGRIPDNCVAGQILLMHPTTAPTLRRPVYVAVLAQRDQEVFVAAPYGRFSVPATPGELLTGRQPAPLRVLCLWNARRVREDLLARSWIVDRMSGQELEDALLALESLKSGKLPARLTRRTGPPLLHPSDPRHLYEDEEAEWAADFAESTPETLTEPGLTYLLPKRDPSELPKAAEPRDSYDDDSPSTSGTD